MRIFTRRKVASIVAGFALVLVPASALAGWGPARPTFTWKAPANYVTFNSITDNPQAGDERAFLDARDAAGTTYTDKLTVHDNEEVVLRVYYHNNAASNLNLTAKNTTVRVALPKTAATATYANGHINASNANPIDVADTVDFVGSDLFTMSYEAGSAQIWNNSLHGAQLSDNIVSTGALIGFDKLDGKVPGCAQFSGYVTIKVRVHMQTPPQSSFACTALDVAQIDKTRFDFTAHATVANATVNGYSFTVKNSNGQTVDTQTVNTSALSAVYHFNQSAAGTYTVSAVVKTDKGNTNGAAPCVAHATVTVTPPVTPPTTPPATSLPNTGPGEIAGLFAGASAAGTAAHVAFSARRNRREQ
jgi:hypothetical protein